MNSITSLCTEVIRSILRIPIKILDWKRKRDDWDQDKPKQKPESEEE